MLKSNCPDKVLQANFDEISAALANIFGVVKLAYHGFELI